MKKTFLAIVTTLIFLFVHFPATADKTSIQGKWRGYDDSGLLTLCLGNKGELIYIHKSTVSTVTKMGSYTIDGQTITLKSDDDFTATFSFLRNGDTLNILNFDSGIAYQMSKSQWDTPLDLLGTWKTDIEDVKVSISFMEDGSYTRDNTFSGIYFVDEPILYLVENEGSSILLYFINNDTFSFIADGSSAPNVFKRSN